ncbi:MAG TPA: acetyl-CoA carboxylase biotin carboxylase subunit [Chloroflexia bacterium]|nr:acetyl-CoA carboxylase biotin carboxylase subunit [Chloroflexia bacterium]
MPAIRKVLIANRSEIALRVVRACAEIGIESVAVYSEADRTSLHVRAADEAYCIGPPPSSESYLRIDKIIETAQRAGADAIHPGYGFLAENAGFADAVQGAGLTWIGPPPEAMRLLGDKLAARKVAQSAGVPVVPGTDVEMDRPEEAATAAEKIGYPVLVKASAGGGGKGMRVVRAREELEAALRTARSEAQSAFGSGVVYLEKYLDKVRHVEIQLIGDQHGNVIHLGERECSIQRRHQKLIEESPSVAVDEKLRARMGEVAVAAAKASGYYSAGTVEFLLDRDKNFYFLEVNARLQVEHPVTEMVTGIDLVIEQLRVAGGRKLSVKQSDVKMRGHAIECRITAEDPFNNFAPSLGEITTVAEPSGPGVRVDSSIYRGGRVPIYYDPMLAKLIVWAPTRAHAILRMRRALEEYRLVGVHTVVPFHIRVMDSLDFQRGNLDTGFVADFLGRAIFKEEGREEAEHIAGIAAALVTDRKRQAGTSAAAPGQGTNGATRESNWRREGRKAGLR